MSFSTIMIYVQLPIINGFVQLPPNTEKEKTKVSGSDAIRMIDGAIVVRLTNGSGKQTGSKFGAQEFLRLPSLTPGSTYIIDPVEIMSD